MKRSSKTIVLILTLFTCFHSFAQVKDSLPGFIKKDTLRIFWVNEDAFNFKYTDQFYQKIDTSIIGIQKKFLLKSVIPFAATFSNSGLAYRNLEFQSNYSFGFTSSHQYYKDYFLTDENAKYFNVVSPYANLFLMMGPKREQIFNLVFTRNFKKNLNLSANYKLIHSLGTYQRSKSDDAFVQFTGNYSTKNKRYIAIGNYFYNRMKVQESGGIKNDSDFTHNIEPNRSLIGVNLNNPDNAALSNFAENHIKESGVFVKQFYFLGFGGRMENDSSKVSTPYYGLGRITHSFLFKNQSYVYIDAQPLSGFYPVAIINNKKTDDSIHTKTFENTISWSNLKFEDICDCQHLITRFGLKHRYVKLYSYKTDTTLSSIIPEASMIFKPISSIELSANAFYIINGYNKDDYSLTGMLVKYIKSDSSSNNSVGLKFDLFRQSPFWFDQKYFGNNFSWDYHFNATTVQKASIFFKNKGFDVSLNYYQIKNIIYYDNYARPKQFTDYSELLQFKVVKDFKWRKWELDNNIVYQKNFNEDIVRVPNFMTNNAFCFTQDLLKKALTMQFGLEMTLMSSYKELAWMPANRVFYLQNESKTDNYPFIDLFINIKIKRALIYLKMDHLNSGIMGYNYFLIPHYPMSDRAVKFGVSWSFYN